MFVSLDGAGLIGRRLRVQRPFLGALAAAVAAGALFHRLGVPVAWLLGPLFAGAALAIARGSAAAWMSPGWIRASQGWIGMSVGAAFSFDGFLAAADFLPVMFAAVAGTLLLSLAGGWLIWRLTGLDRRTSLLGSTPGAASTMVILSGELGADARMVALLQFMRHVAMLAAAPVLISQAFSSVGGSMPAQMEPPPQEAALMGSDVGAAADVSWTAVPIWALCAWAGTAVGRRLRLPAYGFLGPMLAAMALANLFPGPKAPGSIFEAALGVVGLSVGLQFDTAALRRMGPVAVVNAIWIVVLTAGCAGLGWMYARISGSALATGLLATAPGGMEAMVAAAIEMGADVTTVVTLQTLRLLTILIAAPTLARRWRARRNA